MQPAAVLLFYFNSFFFFFSWPFLPGCSRRRRNWRSTEQTEQRLDSRLKKQSIGGTRRSIRFCAPLPASPAEHPLSLSLSRALARCGPRRNRTEQNRTEARRRRKSPRQWVSCNSQARRRQFQLRQHNKTHERATSICAASHCLLSRLCSFSFSFAFAFSPPASQPSCFLPHLKREEK